MKRGIFALGVGIFMMAATVIAQPPPTVIDNFSGGVSVGNHPYDAGHPQNGFWYDATSDAFATPAAGTLNASASLRHNDGGFTNGIYRIYNSVVPRTSTFQASVFWDVVEDGTNNNGVRAYQMGVIVNGVHRTLPTVSRIAGAPASGTGTVVTYGDTLDINDNNANPPRTDTSGTTFNATIGDNLLISFATDVTSGLFNGNSGTWGTSHVLMDDITLIDTVVPVDVSAFSVE